MLTLAFDTSTQVLSVALLEDGEVLDTFSSDEQKTHSERLMPAIDLLLKRNGKSVAELDLVVAGNGPGSYTGIRIALSTALGLTFRTNTKVITGSTLCAMAAASRRDELVIAVLDARGGRVFAGGYRNGSVVIKDSQTTALELAQSIRGLLEEKKWNAADVRVSGNGASLVEAALDTLGFGGLVRTESDVWPDAVFLARYGIAQIEKTGRGYRYDEVKPFYAAKTQAERLSGK